jgi:PAS domain S-box-containing protein
MIAGRAILGRAPPRRVQDYGFALAAAALAVCCRAAIEPIAPGIGIYVWLLPAVVISSVLWGSRPAVIAAAAGGVVASTLFLRTPLFSLPLFNAAQIDAILYLPACAAVIWAAHALRQAAATASFAEARLAEVFRQVPGAAAILEAPHGRLLLRSTQSDMVLGHAQRNVASVDDMTKYGGLHPDGRPFTADEYPIARALRTGETVDSEHIRYRRPDGALVDLEVHAGPVRGPDGEIVAAVGMAFDITERIAAERRLRNSEATSRAMAERLRAAIDAGGLGLWEIDLLAQTMQLDAAMAAMLGLPPVPVTLHDPETWEFIHPEDRDRVRATMQEAVTAGGTYAEECRMRTVQGRIRWVISRGTVLTDVQKIVGVISDITERREREDRLVATLEARDVLMHEADHRIKNSLQLVTSLLRLQSSKAADSVTKHALGEAIARVDAIANAHLSLEQSPDLRTIEIDQMLENLCHRLGALNPAVAITCHAAAGVGLDAAQGVPLGLIASEVLTNALRHAFPAGSGGTVTVTVRQADAGLELRISDNGAGLPATAKRQGLGSTVMSALARQIGAAIDTVSAPGQGVAVTVRLPLPELDADAGRAAPQPDHTAAGAPVVAA